MKGIAVLVLAGWASAAGAQTHDQHASVQHNRVRRTARW